VTPAGAAFAVVAVTLLIAHSVADHWVQTGAQALDKGLPGRPGRRACAAHVLTYTLTTTAAVGAVWWLFALPVTWWGFAAGQVVSAGTHYWADRRFTLEWVTTIAPFRWMGKHEFYRLGAPRQVLAYDSNDVAVELRRTNKPWEGPGPWDNPTLGTGAYALDQSWHIGWLGVAAVVTVVL
jgi:hypothetical protein